MGRRIPYISVDPDEDVQLRGHAVARREELGVVRAVRSARGEKSDGIVTLEVERVLREACACSERERRGDNVTARTVVVEQVVHLVRNVEPIDGCSVAIRSRLRVCSEVVRIIVDAGAGLRDEDSCVQVRVALHIGAVRQMRINSVQSGPSVRRGDMVLRIDDELECIDRGILRVGHRAILSQN